MKAAEAIDQLHRNLAASKRASRPDAEAVVISTQDTVWQVLLEIERLRDQVKNPRCYEHYTLTVPELTEEQKQMPSPVPIIPWRDYGKSRQG